MEKYSITGMSCAACQARVEKAVSAVPGVTTCSVSLLTNSMGVEGNAKKEDIIKAVEDAGYGASVFAGSITDEEDILADKETPVLKRRLILSVGFLLVLMYFSMGRMMLGLPLPSFLDGNHVAMGIIQMILALIVMFINRKFFISGFKGAIHAAPNMDTLVALGSGASFIYSTAALIKMAGYQLKGDMSGAMELMNEFYFEGAAMILTLITVGKMLEAISKGRTTDAIKSLMKLAPQTATIVDSEGEEKEVPITEVKQGDIFVVKPGESVPVDGWVIEGNSAINESALTGESIPVDKALGDEVSAATINQSGYIKCRATRVGKDTTLSQIIQMVSDAAATKAPIAKVADKVSAVFVPAVIIVALFTLFIWLLVGKEFGFALSRAIAVLVISCPCALGLATPVAIMVGNGKGARNGIMFKTAAALENAGKTKIVAIDKTGTITKGEPIVTDIFPAEALTSSGYSLLNNLEDELVKIAGILESRSEHPIAKAINSYIKELHPFEDDEDELMEITDFEALPGNGLTAVYNGHKIYGGNLEFIEKHAYVHSELKEKAEGLASTGKTPVFYAIDKRLLGIIAVSDTIKEDSAAAIKELKGLGIRVIMLTGDNEGTARAIGEQAGVDDIVAGILPGQKESVIRSLQEYGKVAMVGDGINDAPALTRADTGIAIGAGTDVAIDAADIVLVRNSLMDVASAIRLSRKTLKNIHENLFWAFFYNVIGIPLAAGAYISLFGWALSPMFAAAAMSLSSFFVVTNALRLNLFDIHDNSKDKAIKDPVADITINERKNIAMTKTITIEGMMCGHCEANVKKALEALEGVSEAVVSHEKGTAVVTLSGDVDNTVLTKAVEDKDYKVLGIQ
ncbi:heavy metal translocating P-type ATPase [Butyrivibrio sp. DSM 10294]|uniref:heavy metal translocating P-type ATPase n=1 Tax=Butyrivibrio sp. DSM 10294 TaxID=2972457 RepID=UPI00234F02D5|nr:heavy metal translocating P-type ATPase [Butyrivibrio sp. DSM 10294]MDC7295200.1 heavy metal translocating P-type ATPase [Butyrivibrio sp. DSM 10294]